MKSKLLTEDKSKVLSTGKVRTDKRKDNSGRDDLTFWYEPDEAKQVFLLSIQGIEIFTLEVGSDVYKVSIISAVLDKPIKFVPAPQ